MSHPVNTSRLLLLVLLLAGSSFGQTPTPAPLKGVVVYQTDFGVKDGAVSEMKGVACGVDPTLKLYDLTHEIPAFNIWEASYRLWQTAPYWPAGRCSCRWSIRAWAQIGNRSSRTRKDGQYIVTPDNGTLTLIAEKVGIDAVREIDETKNRRAGSEASYTFHGRDVYSYTAARLAAGVIEFEGVGPELDPAKVVKIDYPRSTFLVPGTKVLGGNIPVLDPQYGNVWTNLDTADFTKLEPAPKPGDLFKVTILEKYGTHGESRSHFQEVVPYANSFGEVPVGKPLLYLNSLMQVSFALNQSSFAEKYHVGSGPDWEVVVAQVPKE